MQFRVWSLSYFRFLMPFIRQKVLFADDEESSDFKEKGNNTEVFMCISLFFSAYLINMHSFVQTNDCSYSNNQPDKAVQSVATVKLQTAIFLSCSLDHF